MDSSKLRSSAFTLWVSAPTLMTSTPVRATAPMVIYAISLWGVGLGGGYLLAGLLAERREPYRA